MQQYFAKDDKLNLYDTDYHHIKNVMRMKNGDLIKVVYDNIIYVCKLYDLSNKCKFEVVEKYKNIDKKYKVDVAFSLIKEQKLNYLLQKCTEAGCDNFIPLNTSRSIVKIDNKKEKGKLDRWCTICKEAAEQSFRSSVPTIESISNLKSIIAKEYDLKLLCSLNENTKSIKKVLQNITNYDKILIVVGPEGGFTKEEEKLLIDNGFISISLGENVYRAETAAVVALAMINYEFGR